MNIISNIYNIYIFFKKIFLQTFQKKDYCLIMMLVGQWIYWWITYKTVINDFLIIPKIKSRGPVINRLQPQAKFFGTNCFSLVHMQVIQQHYMLYHMVFIYCPRKEETSKKHLAVVVKSYLPRLCPEVYCSESFLKCNNPFYLFLRILMDCHILEMIWNSINMYMIIQRIFNRI